MIRQFCFAPEIVAPWVCDKLEIQYLPGKFSAIGRARDNALVGGIIYENFNHASVECHIAGVGSAWLNKPFLFMIFDYPFRQLGVEMMIARVSSANGDCIRFVEKLGFAREAILRGACPDGDLHIYVMRKAGCRWLSMKKGF